MSFPRQNLVGPIAVLADDLTGAAEIAALGASCGRRAAVLSSDREPTGNPDLVVLDTDTRLDAAAAAARRVEKAARLGAVARASLVYKKTDSVLRGPVRAELEAIAAARHLARVLLLPANPVLGRIVEHGRYLIHGRPASQTAFAHDPHHPVHSDDVVTMLAPAGDFPVTSLARSGELPPRGIVIGDASSAADLAAWAARIDAATLPAGAASFFRAILETHGWRTVATISPPSRRGRVLVLSGTAAPAHLPGNAAASIAHVDPTTSVVLDQTPPGSGWHEEVRRALADSPVVQVTTVRLRLPGADGATRIREALTALARAMHRQSAFTHLVVEGGATASAVVRHLGWHQLDVVHEWAQGVVTLRPTSDDRVDLTIKPGSYAWPPEFGKLWFEG